MIEKFEATANTDDARPQSISWPRVVTSDENILKVEQYYQQNPITSIRRAAQALNIKRESLRIIIHYFANLFPYKIQINQFLKPEAIDLNVKSCYSFFFCERTVIGLSYKNLLERYFFCHWKTEYCWWILGYARRSYSSSHQRRVRSSFWLFRYTNDWPPLTQTCKRCIRMVTVQPRSQTPWFLFFGLFER